MLQYVLFETIGFKRLLCIYILNLSEPLVIYLEGRDELINIELRLVEVLYNVDFDKVLWCV